MGLANGQTLIFSGSSAGTISSDRSSLFLFIH
jgi:hypothetical protein